MKTSPSHLDLRKRDQTDPGAPSARCVRGLSSFRVAGVALTMLAANRYVTRNGTLAPYHVSWQVVQERPREPAVVPGRSGPLLRSQAKVLAAGACLLALGAGFATLPPAGPGADSALLRVLAAAVLVLPA